MTDSDSSTHSFSTDRSFEVEHFSPRESPISLDHRGPESYEFELLAQAAAGVEGMELQERMMLPSRFECSG